MKISKLILKTVIAASAVTTLAIAPAQAEYQFGDVSRGIRAAVCEARAAHQPEWLPGHYAFASNSDNSRCGWAYGLTTNKYAIAAALEICELASKTECEIVYSK